MTVFMLFTPQYAFLTTTRVFIYRKTAYLCYLHGLVAVQIPHLGSFITRGCENLTSILFMNENVCYTLGCYNNAKKVETGCI